MEAPMEAPMKEKKAKRAPSAWNTIVSKQLKAFGKGHFKEAMAAASAEYAHHKAGHAKEEKPKRVRMAKKEKMEEAPIKEKKPRKPRAKKEPKEAKASSRVRHIELHI
jgi:hypothetical protein